MHAHVARSAHRGVVVSRDALEHRAAFPHRPVRSLAAAEHIPSARGRRAARTAALLAIAAGERADLVHVHFGYAAPDVVGLVRRRRLPFVLSLHGDDATALPRQQPGHYAELVSVVDRVIVPSRWLADRAEALGFAADRIEVVPAGVDTERFRPSPLPVGAPTVAFVGRLVEKKGLDVLLAAWPRVLAAVPDARLRVLGDGPSRTLLEPAPPGVEHVEPVPARRHDQVRELLAGSTVVASPSRTSAAGDAESLLLVNLEAQASGRPVVTTRHGGIPEFVEEGVSARVVPEGDPVALAAALIEVLADHELAVRLGAAGPAVAARFEVRRCSAAVDAVYDRLIASSPRGR